MAAKKKQAPPVPVRSRTAPRQRTAPPRSDPGTLDDLSPNHRNPRKPWKDAKQQTAFMHSLQTFGDLSGIVFNIKTRQLVGGHKRVDEFKKLSAEGRVALTITDDVRDAKGNGDAVGTLRYGHVTLPNGVRFAYREVNWPKGKESAANLAANKWGAEFDLAGVKELLAEASAEGFDLDLTGFDLADIAGLDGPAAADRTAPGSFPSVDENIETHHMCPSCGYRWSGNSAAPSDDSGT